MENANVKVSVLCTAYNHEKYIRKTLDGFVNQQTNFSYEVIVHDDASTDKTADIIREYAKKYPNIIKPIFQTENQYSKKVNIDREFLRPMAKGEYLAYCEGDDYWIDSQKLQKQVDFLDKHPQYAGSAHNCIFVDSEGNEIQCLYPIYRRYRAHRYTLKRFSRDVVYPGQNATIVFRKSAYDFKTTEHESEFFKMRISTGDKRKMLKILLEGDIYCFEECMSAYRIVTQGGDSWSAANYGKNLSYLLHIASIDFRKYVKKYYGKPFPNYYTTFHTGLACIGKYILKPNEDNKKVFKQLINEHKGILGTIAYLIIIGVISIPLYFVREYERVKYDPQK